MYYVRNYTEERLPKMMSPSETPNYLVEASSLGLNQSSSCPKQLTMPFEATRR